MRQLSLLLLLLVIGLAGCKSASTTTQVSNNAKRYKLSGKVVAVNREKKTATIDHEEIAGYMPAMTMEYPVQADWVWNDLKPGSEIRAELVVDNTASKPYFLDNIGIIAAPDPNNPVDLNPKFAQVGKDIPEFVLTNQDGKKISTKDFRGKALAITFIYSKCPLPEYCIRMSTSFSDLAMKLEKDAALKDKVRLLSISFDPAADTPAKLRSYGIGYMGNKAENAFDIWQLAVGSDAEVRRIADFFGLRYERDANDKTIINHSLRTAVISPEGKVTKVFSGNEWTPVQLLKELEASMGQG